MSEGLLIAFISPPKQFLKPRPIPMDAAMAEVCDKELTDLLAKDAVFLVTDSSWGLVWAYFSVFKPRGRGFRPFINLKPFNQFIKYLHFKMESLDSVRFLVKKGDWFVKLDLKDAYLTIPLHPIHQKFLRFEWRGSISVSVHGIWSRSSALPRIFTKLL